MKEIKYKVSYDDSELRAASVEWKKHNDLISGSVGAFNSINQASQRSTQEVVSNNTQVKKSVQDLQREYNQVEKEAKEAGNAMNNSGKQAKESFTSLGGVVKALGPQILAAFSVGAVIGLGKEIYNITAKFQTLEAVLTNTLGSNSAAQKALSDIKNFAAVTPFSVEQLTDSYVKLTNQGFKPTVEQMRQLGDIASSTGKSFDQLSEAILDAQSGEFERLKEFGIKAKVSGDQVAFTFKGVKTEVDNTAASIQEYILSLGDVEGVTGSMAAISETAAGQVSNLGDSFDSLLTTLGSAQSGIFTSTIQGLNKLVQGLEIAVLTKEQLQKRLDDKEITFYYESSISSIDKEVKAFQKSAESTTKTLSEFYKEKIALGEKSIETDKYYLAEAQKALKEAEATTDEIKIKKAQDDVNSVKLSSEASKLVIAELQNRIKAIEKQEADAAERQQKADEKAHKERLKEIEKFNRESERLRKEGLAASGGYAENADDLDILEAKTKRDQKAKDDELENAKRFHAELSDDTEEFVRKDQERRKRDQDRKDAERKEEERKEKEHQENIEKIKSQAAQTIQGFGNAFFDMETEQRRARLQDIQVSLANELKLAGDNKQQQAFINNKYAIQERQLKRQQAQADKEQAIFNILLNTAVGVTKALASAGPPANFVLAALVGAMGTAQLISASSKPLPKYKRGTKSVPGVDTGEDTVLAMLRPKEKVFSVETSERYQPALDAIFDHKVPADLINSFVLDQKKFDKVMVVNQNSYDPELKKEIRGLRSDIRNKREAHINIDKNGIETLFVSSNNKAKVLNNYFSA